MKHTSQRHGFGFSQVPAARGPLYGSRILGCLPADYGAILDCVFEMADAIAHGNGVPPAQAVTQVLSDEGWKVLAKHRRMIITRLHEGLHD